MTKRELKKTLIKDLNQVIEYLLENVEDSFFDEVVLLKARKSDLDRSIQRNILQQIEINIELNKIRGGLINIINNMGKIEIPEINQESKNTTEESSIYDEDIENVDETIDLTEEELGLFDIEDLLLERTTEFTDNLNRITEITGDLGEDISGDADKLNTVNKSSSHGKRMMQKNIINNSARTLNTYRKRMEVETPIFKDLTEETIKYSMLYIQKIYEYGIETSKQEIIDYHETVNGLYNAALSSRNSLMELYEEMKRVPTMTTLFGKAKKRVIKQMDVFFEIYNKYLSDLESLVRSVDFMKLELAEEEE